jgi:hypothetical protein
MALTQVQGGMILPSTTLTTPIVATTMGVGGATPSTSGSGISFPATANPSSDANTLDDYEEGTWTPYDGSVAGLSFTLNGPASYIKVGKIVLASVYLTYPVTSNTAVSGIGGLPFACDGNEIYSYGYGRVGANLGGGSVAWQLGGGGTTMFANYANNSTASKPQNNNLSGSYVIFNIVYRATS